MTPLRAASESLARDAADGSSGSRGLGDPERGPPDPGGLGDSERGPADPRGLNGSERGPTDAQRRDAAWEGALRFIESELGEAAEVGRMITVQVPPWDPVAVFGSTLGERDDAFFWDPPEGPTVVGLGRAWEVVSRGANRFEAVEAGRQDFLPHLAWSASGPAPQHCAPRLFGGFAFADEVQAPWAEFGAARFTLPRLMYSVQGEQAWLSVAASGEVLASPKAAAELRADVAALGAELADSAPAPAGEAPCVLRESHQPSDARWDQAIAPLLEAIAAGTVEKVVAARTTTLQLTAAPSAAAILRRFGARSGAATRFAFRRLGSTFLGATPELLVRKRGGSVFSEALAGTDADEERLRTPKNLAEHALVAKFVQAELGARSVAFDAPSEPHVRRLEGMAHLLTPMSGELRDGDQSVLRLVQVLHPTPAVGGSPRQDALALIAVGEPFSRGWYAGPVGWVDAEGNGEFRVALRAGLVDGRTAYLFAGAGIVAGSEAAAERREVELKESVFRRALGLSE